MSKCTLLTKLHHIEFKVDILANQANMECILIKLVNKNDGTDYKC